MAYFAQIDDNGTVLQVIAVNNADAPDPAPSHSEPLGQAFIASLGLQGVWRQTSFNHTFRKQFCGPGYRYDTEADVFVAPQPYPSWALDANHDWQAPVPMPQDGNEWSWDEAAQEWVAVQAALLPPVE